MNAKFGTADGVPVVARSANYDNSLICEICVNLWTILWVVMTYLTVSAFAILFLAGRTAAQSTESDSECQGLDKKIVALINQYRELRERRRHLPEGAYDKDLRDYGGKLTAFSSR